MSPPPQRLLATPQRLSSAASPAKPGTYAPTPARRPQASAGAGGVVALDLDDSPSPLVGRAPGGAARRGRALLMTQESGEGGPALTADSPSSLGATVPPSVAPSSKAPLRRLKRAGEGSGAASEVHKTSAQAVEPARRREVAPRAARAPRRALKRWASAASPLLSSLF